MYYQDVTRSAEFQAAEFAAEQARDVLRRVDPMSAEAVAYRTAYDMDDDEGMDEQLAIVLDGVDLDDATMDELRYDVHKLFTAPAFYGRKS